jgi:NADH-quinone oxidoreductase subunit A
VLDTLHALLVQIAQTVPDATTPLGGRVPQSLTQEYGPIFVTIGFAGIMALVIFGLATLLGPKNPTPEKQTTYESGSQSTGAKHVKLSVKFYLTAILFVVFDIVAVFLYPWAVLYRPLGWIGLVEMLVFLAILTIALIYCWKKGALEWET